MIRPTRRFLNFLLLSFVLALLPALWREEAWVIWAGTVAVLFVLFLFDLLLTAGRSSFELTYEGPSRIYIGEVGVGEICLRKGGRRSARSIYGILDCQGSFEAIPPWQSLEFSDADTLTIQVELKPVRRGTSWVDTFWWRWEGPLGLASALAKVEFDEPISVLPNLGKVQDAAMRFMSNPEFLAGIKAERYLGEGSEFDRMREYTQGIDPRTIDWKASARHRRLFARQYRLERNHQIVISFDTGHLMSEPIDGMPRLDHGINAGLLLAWCSLKAQDRVVIHAFDDKVRHFSDSHVGVKSMGRLQQATSHFDYGAAEPNYTLAMTDLAVRLKRRSLIVVLTEFSDSITAEIMVENLRRLSQRHLILFVALRDQELLDLESAEPRTEMAMGVGVLATDLLQERMRVLKQLERAGIMCLDVAPKDLSSSLVNTYLDIKAKERI